MAGTVRDRFIAIAAVMFRRSRVRRLGFLSGLGAALSWYGLSRRRLRRTLRIEACPLSDGDFDWVTVGEFAVAWPRGVPATRLIDALVELSEPSNGHYYFSRTRIPAGGTVLDVGACEGAFAVLAVQKFDAARVWCFEPGRTMSNALRITARRHGIERQMVPVPLALGATQGRVVFYEATNDPLGATTDANGAHADALPNEVSLTTIDEWTAATGVPAVDFIKIDAEGSDLDVLRGARETLRRSRPAIAVTTYHHQRHAEQIADYLRDLDLGYEISLRGIVVFDDVPRPVMLHATAPHAAV